MKSFFRIVQFLVVSIQAALAEAESTNVPISFGTSTLSSTVDSEGLRGQETMKAQLALTYPSKGPWHDEAFAMAAYFLNQRTDEADQTLIAEQNALSQSGPTTQEAVEFRNEAEARGVSASDRGIITGGQFHWHAYLLERIYFLFAHDSSYFPGRMSPAAEVAVKEMLWTWASYNCRLSMTAPEHDHWIWGSENHHSMAWSSFWGAAQIFASCPDYANRKYDDGTTPAEMLDGFEKYFLRYARMQATEGLMIECNSDYNAYALGGWYNMADFSRNGTLRKQMSNLLNLFWTDWALDQIDGVRGGSRHRSYTGPSSTEGSSMAGPAWFHFGPMPGLISTDKSPNSMCPATTFWRPAPIVKDLVLNMDKDAVYESVSRRRGLIDPSDPTRHTTYDASQHADSEFATTVIYSMNPNQGGILRYTYRTPDFVMGTSMVEARPSKDWAAISSQNRWEGVIFRGNKLARVFCQTRQPAKGSSYNANWSVQKNGVLIVQRLKTSSDGKDQMVWFPKILGPVLENEGWVFVETQGAYLAVHPVTGGYLWEDDSMAQHRESKGALGIGKWLVCKDEFSPVILEAARKADCPDFQHFVTATLANPLRIQKNRLDYTSHLNKTTLTLFTDYSHPPLVGGTEVNYAPTKAFDSPFLQGDFKSGIVRIRKQGFQDLVLDFNVP